MQTQITWQAGTQDSIAPIQNVGANFALQLNNDPSTGGATGYVTVNPGFTRVVSVSSQTSDLTAATIHVIGLDANNNVVSDSIIGPGPDDDTFGTTLFKAVTSVTCSLAAVGISIGTLIDDNEDADYLKGQSNFLILDDNLKNYAATIAVNVITDEFYYSVFKSDQAPYVIDSQFGTVTPNFRIDPNALDTAEVDHVYALTSDQSATHALNSPVKIVWLTVNGTNGDFSTSSDGYATITLLQQGVTS